MGIHDMNPNSGRGMHSKRRNPGLRSRRVLPGAATALLAIGVFLAGCNSLDRALNVDTPTDIPAEGLAVPKNAELLVNGAVGDFECAYGAYVALSSVLAHETIDATQTADRWPYDRRAVSSDDARYGTSGCEALGVYTPLSTARWSADNILSHLQEWTDEEVANRQLLIAKAAAAAGYSYLLLGEGFCSMAIDLSAEMTPAQMFQLAVDRFTTAIQAAQAAGDTDLEYMARVGRARAYLDLGQGQNAVADAQLVPAGFRYEVTASEASGRRNNRVYAQSGEGPTGGAALSVGPQYRNMTFDGEADPRVSVSDSAYTATEGTPIYYQRKYTSLSDPLPLATYTEAQLIIAEVDATTGTGAQALQIINDLHAAAGLDPYVPGVNGPADIMTQVVEERNRELWLTGHRFYDINRLSLPLVPAAGTDYRKGGTYGDTRCLPLPDVEVNNNPNIG